MTIRDRIVSMRKVKAKSLKADPRNWRQHPEYQQSALKAQIDKIGWVTPIIARETDDGLMIVDGHLRSGIDPDSMVRVVIVDLDEEEAASALATLDPISAMAEVDAERLGSLLEDIDLTDEGLRSHLSDLVDASTWGADEIDDDDEDDEDDDEPEESPTRQEIKVYCDIEDGPAVIAAISKAIDAFPNIDVS